jgi:hypothetical protein
MGDLMATTITEPDELLAWLAGMRDLGELAPMIAVVRDGRVIASGFIDAPFDRAVTTAFYGFRAEVVAVAFDAAIYLGDDPMPDGATPAGLLAAGDPHASEALMLQWLPRSGAAQLWQRRYRAGAGGLVWADPEHLDDIEDVHGGAYVRHGPIVAALDITDARIAAAGGDIMDSMPGRVRDRATATFLGLELR